jgi:hypothetical protein
MRRFIDDVQNDQLNKPSSSMLCSWPTDQK